MDEPRTAALLLAAAGLLLAVCAVFSRAAGRLGVPISLGFLAIGMLAGSEGIGGIPFEDYRLAYRVGTGALVVILFDGGLNTVWRAVRPAAVPATVLATAGVLGTAALTALAARLAGLEWGPALLLGAIVSSTDAAAVFSTLRFAGLRLRQRVASTVELESGLNDPMAVLLTAAVTGALVGESASGWELAGLIVLQLAVGAAAGLLLGWLGRTFLVRARLAAAGLYAPALFAWALLVYGLATLAQGSGFLAVYVAGMVVGSAEIPYRAGVLRAFDAFAWFAHMVMFLVLGLLAFPSRLAEVALPGLAVAALLAFVGRPLVVAACLVPFRYPLRETLFIGWTGLRGAVPIVLATFPVVAAAPGAERVFDFVFFVVVASAVVPGMTVRAAARLFGVEGRERPTPPAVLEFVAGKKLDGEILSFHITESAAVAGARIAEVPFPERSAAVLVVRGEELIAAKGGTVLSPGDHVFVFCRRDDAPLLRLLFGRPLDEPE